jgi:hypothetical protein
MTADDERREMTPAHTLPGEYFTSPDILAEELRGIFRRNWVCVDRADRLAQAGDYLLADVGEQSVIVLRDGSGQLRHCTTSAGTVAPDCARSRTAGYERRFSAPITLGRTGLTAA